MPILTQTTDARRAIEADILSGSGDIGLGSIECAVYPGCEAPETMRSQNGTPGMNQFEKSLRKEGYSLVRPRSFRSGQ